MKHLTLVAYDQISTPERRFVDFAGWMGITVQTVLFDGGIPYLRGSGMAQDRSLHVIAVHSDTLDKVLRCSENGIAYWREYCEASASVVVIFGCCTEESQADSLREVTRGVIRGMKTVVVDPDGEPAFHLSSSYRAITKQLTGISFSAGKVESVPAFEVDETSGRASTVMKVMNSPLLVYIGESSDGGSAICAVAGGAVPPLDEQLSPDNGIERYYDRIIPYLIILRYLFPGQCWSGVQSTARLIIDDPLLTVRYGFLNYGSLFSSMLHYDYGTSIAFIPWNHRRTLVKRAKWFLSKMDKYSICVHGCDHTNREFGSLDEDVLWRKARLSLSRMEQHHGRTGLPFERVMVFPQGRFSTVAVRALRTTGYVAAVNSSGFPVDYGTIPLTIADFLRLAVTRYDGFPIFLRRSPQKVIHSAFDLFLGRPALLVEHHQDFREGYGSLEEFVAALHDCDGQLKWPTLSSQLTESCMVRELSAGLCAVQFYTRCFVLKNPKSTDMRFVVEKHEPDPARVVSILVDGKETPFVRNREGIQLEVGLRAGAQARIEVQDISISARVGKAPGVTYSIGVFLRRTLSECRDNALEGYPALLNVASGIARGLKMTGDAGSERK